MVQRFFGVTLPALVTQLTRLNNNMELQRELNERQLKLAEADMKREVERDARLEQDAQQVKDAEMRGREEVIQLVGHWFHGSDKHDPEELYLEVRSLRGDQEKVS